MIPTTDFPQFVLSTENGEVCRVPASPAFRSRCKYWSSVSRNRARWNVDPWTYAELAEKTRDELAAFLEPSSAISLLDVAATIEVSCPATLASSTDWNVAGIPWEYVLAAATYPIRGERGVTICRRMEVAAGAPRSVHHPKKALIVISGPGAINDYYSFDTEAKLIATSLSCLVVETLRNPTLEELHAKVADVKPDIVHVTGVDLHQGSRLLFGRDTFGPVVEGIYMHPGDGTPEPIQASDLTKALTAAARKPLFIGYNFYNSAFIAAESVRNGAAHSIAFHDTFDDALAETLFIQFYKLVAENDGDVFAAFNKAWGAIRDQRLMTVGSGVVLWSAPSVTQPIAYVQEAAPAPPPAPSAPASRAASQRRGSKRVTPQVAAATPPEPQAAPPPQAEASGNLVLPSDPYSPFILPRKAVNYSLLHNQRGLFERFQLKNLSNERLDLDVDVALHVGDKPVRFQRKFTLEGGEPVRDVTREIYIPLTWVRDLLHESVRTTVRVEIKHPKKNWDDTFPIDLLPVDEWTDDDVNRQWLASFVLPRDPAVSNVISGAEKVLPTLADRAEAGFDGYQSVDPRLDDPFVGVDNQVQSIWAALALNTPIRYVNPPPTYTKSSQRLRTPSQVLSGQRGTCIDLSLLVAACLEFVDIYPVVFLLEGHAFVGYWRDTNRYETFLTTVEDRNPEDMVWLIDKAAYEQIMDYIRGGALVPLETTLLTQRSGFADAVEEGFANLRKADDFQALIDVSLARRNGVTPLPLGSWRDA